MLGILSSTVFKIFFPVTNDRPNQCPVNYASKRFSMIDGLSDVKEAEASTLKDVGKQQKVHNFFTNKTIFSFEDVDVYENDNYQWPR